MVHGVNCYHSSSFRQIVCREGEREAAWSSGTVACTGCWELSWFLFFLERCELNHHPVSCLQDWLRFCWDTIPFLHFVYYYIYTPHDQCHILVAAVIIKLGHVHLQFVSCSALLKKCLSVFTLNCDHQNSLPLFSFLAGWTVELAKCGCWECVVSACGISVGFLFMRQHYLHGNVGGTIRRLFVLSLPISGAAHVFVWWCTHWLLHSLNSGFYLMIGDHQAEFAVKCEVKSAEFRQ